MTWPHRGVAFDAPIVPIKPKWPDTAFDFFVPVPCDIDPTADFIATVTLACAPSGTGEMQISNLVAVPGGLSYTATGGQPGRLYRLKFSITMVNGRVFSFLGEQWVTALLPGDQPFAPTSPGFGTAITADLGSLSNNNNVVNSSYAGFRRDRFGLLPGDFWRNGDEINVVPDTTPDPAAPFVLFSNMTTLGLLLMNGKNFPKTSPQNGSGVLWNNGNVLCIA
jgi:hypothetical protein